MKFVKSVLKVWPEIMVLLISMSYIIIRLVADINKVSLPTWFDNLNIPTIALFMMVFILLYRSKKRTDKFEVVDNLWVNRSLVATNQKRSNYES